MSSAHNGTNSIQFTFDCMLGGAAIIISVPRIVQVNVGVIIESNTHAYSYFNVFQGF